MVAHLVASLRSSLPQVRLESYRPPGGSDLEMLTNYFWDIALAEALMPALHGVELALRNSLHTQITRLIAGRYGEMWFGQAFPLQQGQQDQLTAAYNALARRRIQPAPGHIVAELPLGFWVALISDPYHQSLWQPNRYALLKAVFPNVSGLSRQSIHRRYNFIRLGIRNRVFHYEAIWDRPDLRRDHADIRGAIRWINPTLDRAIGRLDRFDQVLNSRAQIQLDLKREFGIP
jgi:hypothetical protein